MIVITSRSVVTFLVAGVVFISIPIAAFFTFRHFGVLLITNDNADIVFKTFQEKLDKGALVGDGSVAADIAERAYREQMHATPMDGWGKPLRIRGEVTGRKCTLVVESAGGDGAFGTPDDVKLKRNFDLPDVTKKVATTFP